MAVLTAPVIAGYSFNESPDLTDAAERERLSPSAIKAFVNITQKWGLNEEQKLALLGGIASSTFHEWRKKPSGKKT